MKLSNNKKRQIRELLEQAKQALASRRLDIFDQLCRKIETIQPDNPDTANLRGIVCCNRNQLAEAEKLFVNAINAAPKRSDFHHNLARLYWNQGLYADALERCRAVLRLEPNSLQARLGVGNCLIKLRQSEDALPILEKAKPRNAKDPALLIALATAYYETHRFQEAREHLQTLLDQHPDHPDAHLQMGKLLIEEGNLDAGEKEVRAAISLRPNFSDAHVLLAVTKKHDSENDADIAELESLYQQAPADSPERVRLGFALGKVMDDLENYDRAFDYFKQANDIRHRHSTYHQDQELEHLQNIMETYTPEMFGHGSSLDDDTPVFILGMPRCGSTLVEQMLASHPDVESRGECEFFERVLADENRPGNLLTLERLAAFTSDDWQRIGTRYLKRLKQGSGNPRHITDKTLGNIRLVGAIHCALPKAKIVHVRRHPLATCVSIYNNNLLGQQLDYGRNLGQLGYYYRMYLRLMQHWREVLPTGVMYELDYEHLVANQEDETRKLLDFCGLPWDDRCLQFNKADNLVRTASAVQVRRGIYTDSVAAWQHYEKHLEPLIRILGPENSTGYRVPA